MDENLTHTQTRIRDHAHSLGYGTPVFHRPVSGRGRPPIDIDALLLDLIEAGHPIDKAWLPGLPFLGDPDPQDAQHLLWGFSEAGLPNYVSRTDFIRLARRALRPPKPEPIYLVKARLREAKQAARLAAREARREASLAQLAKLEARIEAKRRAVVKPENLGVHSTGLALLEAELNFKKELHNRRFLP